VELLHLTRLTRDGLLVDDPVICRVRVKQVLQNFVVLSMYIIAEMYLMT